jgi:cytosine/uracil/thiamine/allantoin permease
LTGAALILLALTGPWAAIVGIGHIRRRGRYDLDALQVFNRRQTGGIYWYRTGWNWRAVLAWAIGAAFGLTTVTTTQYTGPFADDVAGGIDVSFLGSYLLAGTLYLLLERVPTFGSGIARPPASAQEPRV